MQQHEDLLKQLNTRPIFPARQEVKKVHVNVESQINTEAQVRRAQKVLPIKIL